MNIFIKKAAPEDADSLAVIQKQAFERLYHIYHDEASPYLRGSDEIRRWLEGGTRHVYKIFADDMLCGGITIFDRGNGEYYLARLYILPELQGKGIGKEAIRICEDNYSNAKRWSLDFPSDQIANKKCYEHSGYYDTGLREVKSDTLTLAVYDKIINGIYEIRKTQLALATEVIRSSFITVAKEFGLTELNCPNHTSFMKVEKLQTHFERGYLMFGLYDNKQLIGYVSLSRENEGVVELHNLAVLPEYRHKGYGKQLLDFCKSKVKESGSNKITIGIIEENNMLKNWYAENGFVHTGTHNFAHLPFTVGFMKCEV